MKLEKLNHWLRKHNYSFPLIGGILTLGSFFIPMAWFDIKNTSGKTVEYSRIWNLGIEVYYLKGLGQFRRFLLNYSFLAFLISIIYLIIIFSSSILMLRISYDYWKSKSIRLWMQLCIELSFFTCILWILSMELFLSPYVTPNTQSLSFWNLFHPTFGIILPFFGAGFTTLGIIIQKKTTR